MRSAYTRSGTLRGASDTCRRIGAVSLYSPQRGSAVVNVDILLVIDKLDADMLKLLLPVPELADFLDVMYLSFAE